MINSRLLYGIPLPNGFKPVAHDYYLDIPEIFDEEFKPKWCWLAPLGGDGECEYFLAMDCIAVSKTECEKLSCERLERAYHNAEAVAELNSLMKALEIKHAVPGWYLTAFYGAT